MRSRLPEVHVGHQPLDALNIGMVSVLQLIGRHAGSPHTVLHLEAGEGDLVRVSLLLLDLGLLVTSTLLSEYVVLLSLLLTQKILYPRRIRSRKKTKLNFQF